MKALRIEIPEESLKEILKEVIEDLIKNNPELIKEILEEVIEDIAIGKAINEGLKSENVDKEEIMKLLNAWFSKGFFTSIYKILDFQISNFFEQVVLELFNIFPNLLNMLIFKGFTNNILLQVFNWKIDIVQKSLCDNLQYGFFASEIFIQLSGSPSSPSLDFWLMTYKSLKFQRLASLFEPNP